MQHESKWSELQARHLGSLPLLLFFVVVETFESEKETEISKASSYTVYCPERGIMLIIH